MKWATVRPDSRAALRLFCLPYAGGGAAVYRNWGNLLPAGVEVCPVHLPGREGRMREQPIADHAALVDALAEGLLPYMDRPFALFGHSMGALLAFELTRRLRRAGAPGPVHLLVSAHRAPDLPRTREPVHDLPRDEFLASLRRLGGTPEEVLAHEELMELLMPLLRADFAVVERYRYEPEAPLACPVSAFGGLADAEVPPNRLDGWAAHTTGAFRLQIYPGGHFYLNSGREALLRDVGAALAPYIR